MEFSGGAVVRAPLLPLQGVGVQSLVGELRSHLTRSEAKEVKKKKKRCYDSERSVLLLNFAQLNFYIG